VERPQPASLPVTLGGVPAVVHAFPTGLITIKRCHFEGCLPEFTPGLLRFFTILADWSFAPPIPIWTYVVEHPDGLVVVDAGATPDWYDEASWEGDRVTERLVHSFIRIDVRADETLPSRLRAAGLDPHDVRAVVLTHQHVDHTASVPAYPQADVWTTAAEDEVADEIGALHGRWRTPATKIRYVDVEADAQDPLGPSVALTGDGRIRAIATPGHTPGSVTVVLDSDQGPIWFVGDTTFTEGGLDPSTPTAGIHADLGEVRALQAALRERTRGGLVLPSHDVDAGRRLAGGW